MQTGQGESLKHKDVHTDMLTGSDTVPPCGFMTITLAKPPHSLEFMQQIIF